MSVRRGWIRERSERCAFVGGRCALVDGFTAFRLGDFRFVTLFRCDIRVVFCLTYNRTVMICCDSDANTARLAAIHASAPPQYGTHVARRQQGWLNHATQGLRARRRAPAA